MPPRQRRKRAGGQDAALPRADSASAAVAIVESPAGLPQAASERTKVIPRCDRFGSTFDWTVDAMVGTWDEPEAKALSVPKSVEDTHHEYRPSEEYQTVDTSNWIFGSSSDWNIGSSNGMNVDSSIGTKSQDDPTPPSEQQPIEENIEARHVPKPSPKKKRGKRRTSTADITLVEQKDSTGPKATSSLDKETVDDRAAPVPGSSAPYEKDVSTVQVSGTLEAEVSVEPKADPSAPSATKATLDTAASELNAVLDPGWSPMDELSWGSTDAVANLGNWDEDNWGAAGTVPAYDFDPDGASEDWDSPKSSGGQDRSSSPTSPTSPTPDGQLRAELSPDPDEENVKISIDGLPIPTVAHNDFEKLDELIQSDSPYLGLGLHLAADCKVIHFVLATLSTILIIDREKLEEKDRSTIATLLTSERPTIIALDLGRLALTIYRETKLHIRGVDLGSSFTGSTRIQFPSLHMAEVAVKNHDILMELATALESNATALADVGLRRAVVSAFFCYLFASSDVLKLQSIRVLDTRKVEAEDLSLMMTIQLQWDFLQSTKPARYENDFEHVIIHGVEVIIRNARYATKVREGSEVILTFDNDEVTSGRAVRVRGRETFVRLTDGAIAGSSNRQVKSIQVVTMERLSNSEIARRDWVLQMLSKPDSLRERNDVLRTIWLPNDRDKIHIQVETQAAKVEAEDREEFFGILDPSQSVVACAMLNRNLNIVVTHGPPGSGKTYTIRAALDEWASKGESTWVIAQSNVGVKNIAESLSKNGFDKYKLLVSSEFYEDWHESIYLDLRKNLIRSDELPDRPETMKFVFASSRVILCTLSMLSNPILTLRGLFECNPVHNLVVDEASQVYLGDYIHILYRFPVRKVCFFGDPNQLPPFGAESRTDLGTVFDVPHLNDNSLHLSTTYRMPSAIGTFLSDEVYNYSLSCRHKSRSTYTLAFINARRGMETKVGMSWKNAEEAYLIVRLVIDYYHSTDFVIITPYDAQRAAIDRELKAVNPNWKGKVFNVDSFQGSEADYVLVSLTRTSRPGFLQDERRVNVMLSRCKKGMVIVSKKTFLHRRDIRETLIGKLAERWKAEHPTDPWVDFLSVLEGTADLPGAPKRREATRTHDAEWANEVYSQQNRSKISKPKAKNPWNV